LFEFGFAAFVLTDTLSMGFMAHYNGCKYYRELQDHSPAKLRRVVAVAMGIAACIFGVSMVAGFVTFGTTANGVILNSYSDNDWPINIARFGMGLSIVASFPICFSGLREAVVTILKASLPVSAPSMDFIWCQDVLSVVLLTAIVGLATVLVDAGMVVDLVGALCGSTIIYIVPSVLYAATIPLTRTTEIVLTRAVSIFGLVLMLSGVIATLVYD
jgi:sodium-coupled neutral amino acid transporter 11